MSALSTFLADAHRNFEREVQLATERMRQSILKKLRKNKALSKLITDEFMNMACERIRVKLMTNFKTNMGIFEMYFKRNMNVNPPSVIKTMTKVELQDIIHQQQARIDQLTKKHQDLHREVVIMTHSQQEYDSLHVYITDIVYNLRVCSQSFNTCGVHPLHETISDLLAKKNDLLSLINKSNESLLKISLKSHEEDNKYDALLDFVDMDDEEATRVLNKSMF